jgi:hypothetical protein
MTSPKTQYISEIRRSFGYTPVWLPNATVQPGDIVLLDDDSPTRIDTLRRPGLNFNLEIREDNSTGDIHYTSAEGVSVTFKAAGSAPIANSVLATGDAGMIVEFSRRNAVLLEALGCKTKYIADQVALAKQILELYHADQWEKEWAVVTEVVQADSLIVFLSNTSEAKIELKAEGKFNAGSASLASASASFSIAVSKNMATQIVATKSLTPFYKAYGIKGLLAKEWARRANEGDDATTLADVRQRYRSQMTFAPLDP